MEVVALRTEHDGAVGWDGVEFFLGNGGDNDGATDGVNTGVGNAWSDKLAVIGQRTEVLLD